MKFEKKNINKTKSQMKQKKKWKTKIQLETTEKSTLYSKFDWCAFVVNEGKRERDSETKYICPSNLFYMCVHLYGACASVCV